MLLFENDSDKEVAFTCFVKNVIPPVLEQLNTVMITALFGCENRFISRIFSLLFVL